MKAEDKGKDVLKVKGLNTQTRFDLARAEGGRAWVCW